MRKTTDPGKLLLQVGRRIAELRAEQEFTQAEFAERLGMSVQHLSHIETGAANLTLTSLAKLAGALGVQAVDLLLPPKATALRVKRGRPRKAR